MLAQTNIHQKNFQAFMKPEQLGADTLDQTVKITSRFGEVTVSLKSAIEFPHGLLGLPQFKSYCLTDMPNPKLGHFKLLQSLDDAELSFAVLPIEPKNALMDDADIEECCQATGVARKDLGLLLVVSVHRQPVGPSKITANVRAPIVIDTSRKLAMQYVFLNNKYQIAYELN